ncbi:MAG TPA: DUF1127 domain-containing protein [Beijerinckiaceae bacterium]|jgi:uncharacterized protein YjiS (DUF1127 family)
MSTTTCSENLRLATAAQSQSRLLRAVLVVEYWMERHRQRRALLELDGAMLTDLGLSPADAAAEGAKPFWRA